MGEGIALRGEDDGEHLLRCQRAVQARMPSLFLSLTLDPVSDTEAVRVGCIRRDVKADGCRREVGFKPSLRTCATSLGVC